MNKIAAVKQYVLTLIMRARHLPEDLTTVIQSVNQQSLSFCIWVMGRAR